MAAIRLFVVDRGRRNDPRRGGRRQQHHDDHGAGGARGEIGVPGKALGATPLGPVVRSSSRSRFSITSVRGATRLV
jgi:hypothetical protein